MPLCNPIQRDSIIYMLNGCEHSLLRYIFDVFSSVGFVRLSEQS